MVRKTWPGYVALYKSKAGDKVVIKSVSFPPKTRILKGQGGLRKYRRIKYQKHLQEVLIVAKATKKGKGRTAEVTDSEIDDLEGIDDLDDLEEDLEDEEPEDEVDEDDEDTEDEDEDDEDEDDDEEVVVKKKSKKSKTKPTTSRAAANGKVGSAEIAKEAGIDARRLRMVLRKHEVEKDEESGRYEWSSMKHPTVKKILKWIKDGEADDIVKEQLQKLKDNKAKKASKKKKVSKDAGAKTKKTKKKVVEDEDDE